MQLSRCVEALRFRGGLCLIACASLLAWDVHGQLLAPPPLRPDVVMRSATSEVTAVLSADAAAGRPTDMVQLMERRIVPVFDFPRMTAAAMGRDWRLASPEQQAALVAQFKALLVRSYSVALAAYRDQEIRYMPLRAAPGETGLLVRSSAQRAGAEALTIDYEMADGLAGWKVHDITLGGVSLVMTYRESFAATVRANGIDGLIESLSARNRSHAAER